MGTRTTQTVRLLGIVLLLLGAILAGGCSRFGTSPSESGTASSGMVAEPAPDRLVGKSGGSSQDLYDGAPASVDAAALPLAPQASLVISTAGIDLEVKDLDAAVAAIRELVTKYGATIAHFSASAGGQPVPVPQPLDESSVQYSVPAPGGATITLRIPAEKLAAAEKDIAALGRVISQSASQDDVTQQHVDMKARLKNLQAEEVRLRTFFDDAKRVSEMLAIEQELARVRGEIESMQAQITYLERQSALATLTVTLSQPGALVSPAAGGWGFSEAIREGVRAAAAVTRSLITSLLAFTPIIVIGLILFVVIRALVVRRRSHRAAASSAEDGREGAAAAQSQPPVEQ